MPTSPSSLSKTLSLALSTQLMTEDSAFDMEKFVLKLSGTLVSLRHTSLQKTLRRQWDEKALALTGTIKGRD